MEYAWRGQPEREPLLPSRSQRRFVQPPVSQHLQPVGAQSSRVYRRRWLVLAVFSLFGFMQGMVWNTWGPIQNSAKQAYGFSSLDIALLVLWGPIGFLPCFLFMWLLDKKGLRVSTLLTSFLMVLGSGLRCIPVSDHMVKRWLIHIGQLFNGFGGPLLISAPPFLSATWFPADQRATATAIASLVNYLGAACAFIVGPLVVPGPNNTLPLQNAMDSHAAFIRDRVQAVLYAEFGLISLGFAATFAYFPSQPPFPPSVTAGSQRLSYRSSICRLVRNCRFLMIAVAYAIPLGVLGGWTGVLDMILTQVNVSQVDAGWIGFWSIIGGCVVGLAMARFADFIRGMLKLILVLMLAGATLSSTWFTLTDLTSVIHLPLTKGTLYTSCILIGIFLNSCVPIFFELFVETVYPIPEGITCGFVTLLTNVFMGVLLFFLTVYHTDVSWMNWCLTGSCFFSLFLVLCFKESYDRLYVDVFVSV
ncbi:solute carrier family 49 member 4 [Protopterus annectens]|uniref:solute carrier family 49 member 4 n=1 Tax=Protopterus annectens TaxID=7888 RepID=UPI001CFB811F|nr:solute carrier family 49 member 4 [Protopterus annectens]